jgi:hypothetical protein
MKIVTIRVLTALYDDPDIDKLFYEYLDEYSISHKIATEPAPGDPYPEVDYTGGPIALRNMLKERFGYEREEIESTYPELMET